MKTYLCLMVVWFCYGCSESADLPPTVDVVIVGGDIIDGSGTKSSIGNVEIVGAKITYVGPARPVVASRTIDASGLVVSPGFIDPHTHADTDLAATDGAVNEAYLRQGVTTVFVGNDGGGTTVATARQQFEANSIGTNIGLLSGHGALRETVMGFDDRAPTSAELEQLKQLLAADMRAGALGLSSGLFYSPGSFAKTDELVALAKVAAEYGGVYESHIRDESNYSIGLLAAIDELIAISEQAKIPAHVAHIKALGPAVHGQSEQIVQHIEQARSRGLTITADQYPWLASGTRLSNALVPRSLMAGGVPAMEKRLADDDFMVNVWPDMQANLVRRGGAESMLITGESKYRGKTLQELSEAYDRDVLPMAVEIILSGDPAIASFMMAEDDVERLIVQPWVVTGSDGSTGHPRLFGSFPKKFETYVVAQQLLTREEFVRQSSARTAEIFGLCDRGRLQAGYVADISVWHANQYHSTATYEQPTELAEGVAFLFVNGQLVIDNKRITQSRSGVVIDRGNCKR